jgi:hypothetical protein
MQIPERPQLQSQQGIMRPTHPDVLIAHRVAVAQWDRKHGEQYRRNLQKIAEREKLLVIQKRELARAAGFLVAVLVAVAKCELWALAQ